MRVVFTKGPGIGYEIAVHRDTGPELAPRNGPGGHPYLPHDLVHLLVEKEAGIELGVFGQLAAGDNGMFWPVDNAERTRAGRRRRSKKHAMSPRAEADMIRSETLARIAVPVWEVRRGLVQSLPAYVSAHDVTPVVDRIVDTFDDHADRWHALPVGGSLTVTWNVPVSQSRR